MLLAHLVTLSLTLAGPARPAEPAVPVVVTTAWLRAHLHDPSLVLVDVGPRPQYDSLHIQGARYIDFHGFTAPMKMDASDTGLALELPAPARLDSALKQLGVTPDSKIVVYASGGWVTAAARLELTLEWAGFAGQVGFLDGGFDGWRRSGGAVTTTVPTAGDGSARTHPRPNVVVSAAFVRDHLHDSGVAIIDARDAGYYLDTIPNRMPRGGHIPGAHNIPFTSLTDSLDQLKPAADLRRIFEAAGATPGKTVVVYCHIGQQGSWVRYVARTLGYDARLYDGSFQEWSARADLPVEGERRHAAGATQ